uniref:Uncharacterized protein n=1 Tax=Arundo donax TaxID=35708 RepID=A0A0A8XYH6_ARUDO
MGYILEYNLDGHEPAVIKIPSELLTACNGNIMFMPAEDSADAGWSMQDGDDAGWSWEGWSWRKTIHLDHLLPAAQNIELVGFAEGVNMDFLGADDGVFTIELKSEQVRRVCERRGCSGSIKFKTFLPLVSF